MFSLRRQRLRGDMMEVFKMIRRIDKVSCKSMTKFKINLDEFMTARGKLIFIAAHIMHVSFLLFALF